MKNIYLVTTIHIGDPTWQYGILHIQRRRSVGWFPKIKDAKGIVSNNYGDIYECGHYDHCVIESIGSGIYTPVNKEYWYKWDTKKKQYISTSKPKGLERIANFGIG